MATQFEKILVGLQEVKTEQKNTQARLTETNTGLHDLGEKVEALTVSSTANIAVHEERLDTIETKVGKKSGVIATAVSATVSTVIGGLVVLWRLLRE